MKTFTLLGLIGLAGLAWARQCQNISVPVTISAVNAQFNIKTPATNIEVTDLVLNLTQLGKNFPGSITTGNRTINGTYKLAATLCNPDHGQSDTVQLLTHGGGFDRTYWDLPFNNYNYSYVATAVDQFHYSTLTWDRLGFGASQHGDALNEIQFALETEALHALTTHLRQGTLSPTTNTKPFSKITHIGHSFGSALTYALTTQYPTISDGIVLTGFSQNGSYAAYLAYGSAFVQANTLPHLKTYPNGYIAVSSASALHIDFLAPNQFDPAILTYAIQTGNTPITVGELLTLGLAVSHVNPFAGPTLLVTGERDVPFCGGNCLVPSGGFDSIPAAAAATLPHARNFTAVVVPGAGHGLNFEYGHGFVYGTVNEYLAKNVGV